jgi:UDP-N-acetyl-D-galactosamine dehydrogenase
MLLEDSIIGRAGLAFSSNLTDLPARDVIIITVPTPIDERRQSDPRFRRAVAELVGQNLPIGDLVIYESIVYSGPTQEICSPIFERQSGLIWRQDFPVCDSPERINPDDKHQTSDQMIKIDSGDTSTLATRMADL